MLKSYTFEKLHFIKLVSKLLYASFNCFVLFCVFFFGGGNYKMSLHVHVDNSMLILVVNELPQN